MPPYDNGHRGHLSSPSAPGRSALVRGQRVGRSPARSHLGDTAKGSPLAQEDATMLPLVEDSRGSPRIRKHHIPIQLNLLSLLHVLVTCLGLSYG